MSFGTVAQRHGTHAVGRIVYGHRNHWRKQLEDLTHVEAVQSLQMFKTGAGFGGRSSTASRVIFALIRQNGISSSDVLIVFCVGSQISA
jgi:hypothetical protein